MTISAGIVDSREPMNDRLLLVQKYGWVESALPAGDYQWALPKGATIVIHGKTIVGEDNTIVGVEVGTIEDIVSNLDRKREEMIRLSASVDLPILLRLGSFEREVDGTVKGVTSRIPYSTVRKWFMSIQLGNILIADGPHNMRVAAVLDTQKWTQKEVHTSMLPLNRKYKQDPRLLALSMIPGIRVGTAQSILDYSKEHRTIYACNYSIKELEQMPEVGPKRAGELHEFWKQ